MEAKTNMVARPSEIEQVRLLIRSLWLSYYQHLQFRPLIESFTTLRNASMLVEEELSKEVAAKKGNNWRNIQ